MRAARAPLAQGDWVHCNKNKSYQTMVILDFISSSNLVRSVQWAHFTFTPLCPSWPMLHFIFKVLEEINIFFYELTVYKARERAVEEAVKSSQFYFL